MRMLPKLRVVHLLSAILLAIVTILVAVVVSHPTTGRTRETPGSDHTLPGALSRHLERVQA